MNSASSPPHQVTRRGPAIAVCQVLSVGFGLAVLLPSIIIAGSSTSSSYAVRTDTLDAGGRQTASVLYRQEGSLGGIGGLATAGVASLAKHGFSGQLYEIADLVISANPTNINEGATRQLKAMAR